MVCTCCIFLQSLLYSKYKHCHAEYLRKEIFLWDIKLIGALLLLGLPWLFLSLVLLTNRHQLKLRELDIQEKHSSTYNAARASTIEDFISKVGKYISYSSSSARKECAESFFHIYAYTPQSLWPFLDDLNDKLESDDFAGAHELFNGIAKSLACLLKGEPLILPSE